MNLKSLSDAKLLSDIKMHSKNEKESGIAVLHHLREVDARKLFAVNYDSLYGFCLGELGLPETTANRRIQAMRLIRDLPEYENKLQEKSVHEGTLSTVQIFFNREKKKRKKIYSKDQKLEILKEVEGLSVKKTDRLLATISPTSARKETTKPINADETEITFTISKELDEKLTRVKNLLGQKLPDQRYVTLLEVLTDMALKKLEPKPPTVEVSIGSSRYIPANVKRQVLIRDQGQCTYKNPEGKRCTSKHALQFKHIIPFAKGGQTSSENLTLLCPTHNQLSAIQAYGQAKMREYFKS